MKHLLS